MIKYLSLKGYDQSYIIHHILLIINISVFVVEEGYGLEIYTLSNWNEHVYYARNIPHKYNLTPLWIFFLTGFALWDIHIIEILLLHCQFLQSTNIRLLSFLASFVLAGNTESFVNPPWIFGFTSSYKIRF